MNRTRHTIVSAVIVAVLAGAVSCKQKDASPGPLVGPSELGTSITLFASPDLLTQDGVSTSVIDIRARGPNAEPLANVPMRIEICVIGETTCRDFGRLSTRDVRHQ